MAPDRSKAGGNRNRPDILTDPRAIQRVHLDHYQISSHQNVVKTIQDTPITDLADVEVDKTSDDFAAGQSLVWGGDSWIAGDPEVLIPVKAAEEMTKGTPVYVSDEHTSGKPIVSKADSDGTDTYPAIGLLLTDLAADEEGHAVGGGILSGLDTDAYTVGDALYLSSSPGVLTSTRPTATNEKVQKVAVVARSHASAGTVIVMGAGRTNDVPNELTTLTGVALDATDLGTFADAHTYPSTIADNETVKGALQDLSDEANLLYTRFLSIASDLAAFEQEVADSTYSYRGRYDTEAEARRDDNDAAATKTEIYYTARPDGDGYAESEVTTSTPAGAVIERRLYYSDKFDADVNASGDWTAYATQPADDTAFATAKASLLAGLSDTDGTANTRGTLPVSLKMEHTFVTDKLLNDYPALAGFSVRLVRFGYTGDCLRVRRSSDNTEQDIGFDSNGDLDTAAIETFCTTSTGWVTKWYDQSGNSNDAYQTITSLQPQIYDGSSVLIDNGRPSLRATTSSTYLRFASVIISGTSARSMLVVANPDSAVNDNLVGLSSSGSGTGALWNWTPEVRVRVVGDEQFQNNSMTSQTIGMLTFPSAGDTTDIRYFENGSEATRTGGTLATINTSTSGFSYIHSTVGWMQECLMWTSDQSANQSDIHTDIEGHYQLSTQLLLDTYGGAAAAYSVRKLSQWYTGSCMRIREDSGDTETDIGFDSNGDLDTAAIASHCGSANGYVVTWYDQSGNSDDLTQSTTTRQPKIYDGSAVLLKNSKPCCVFDGANSNMSSNYGASISQPFTMTLVVSPAISHTGIINQGDGGTPAIQYVQGGQFRTWAGTTVTIAAYTNNQQYGIFTAYDGASTTYSLNGSASTINPGTGGFTNTGAMTIGSRPNNSAPFNGTMQEMVVWASDQSSSRTGIESNINTYFSIY